MATAAGGSCSCVDSWAIQRLRHHSDVAELVKVAVEGKSRVNLEAIDYCPAHAIGKAPSFVTVRRKGRPGFVYVWRCDPFDPTHFFVENLLAKQLGASCLTAHLEQCKILVKDVVGGNQKDRIGRRKEI